jgi:hypothetical protein
MPGQPVSGPGKFSQRTDKQPIASLDNANYGEQKDYKQLQQDAPVAAAPQGPPAGGGMDFSSMFGSAANRVVPMDAESTQPNVPVTNGASMGAGAGTEALGLQSGKTDLKAMASQLPVIEFMANQPNASWGLRNLVRQIKGAM